MKMSKVINISTHPKFGQPRPQDDEPRYIRGLDGDLIEYEFIRGRTEREAVKIFLCDMGFIISNSLFAGPIAILANPFQFNMDNLSLQLPESFEELTKICGQEAFRNRSLTYPQSVMYGKLGMEASVAATIWSDLMEGRKSA